MTAAEWTTGRGDGQSIRVVVAATCRGLETGWSASIVDARTGRCIGFGLQFASRKAAQVDAQALVTTWWPGATLRWGWLGDRVRIT